MTYLSSKRKLHYILILIVSVLCLALTWFMLLQQPAGAETSNAIDTSLGQSLLAMLERMR